MMERFGSAHTFSLSAPVSRSLGERRIHIQVHKIWLAVSIFVHIFSPFSVTSFECQINATFLPVRPFVPAIRRTNSFRRRSMGAKFCVRRSPNLPRAAPALAEGSVPRCAAKSKLKQMLHLNVKNAGCEQERKFISDIYYLK